MSAVSAVILVGHANPYHGGNRSFAEIDLDEGSRPALVLRWTAPRRAGDPEVFRNFIMIPTVEHMLDDSILMIAYAVCRHSKVFATVNSMTKVAVLQSRRLTMYDDFTPMQREELYTTVRQIDELPKVTWCLFAGTPMNSSMERLSDYRLECEVTRSVYLRSYKSFTGKWGVTGKPS